MVQVCFWSCLSKSQPNSQTPTLSHLVPPSWAALGHYLLLQEANPQPQISKDATEKRVAQTVACYRSEMDGHALCDHLGEQLFRPADGYCENFSSSVSRISEKNRLSTGRLFILYLWTLSEITTVSVPVYTDTVYIYNQSLETLMAT